MRLWATRMNLLFRPVSVQLWGMQFRTREPRYLSNSSQTGDRAAYAAYRKNKTKDLSN